MNNGRTSEEISLKIFDELTKEPVLSQRVLADRLGIALGLVNAYIKKLYKKGYLKVKDVPRNRIKYIITPKGITEKARLTYSYMNRSLEYFKKMRQRIEQTYALMISSGVEKFILWGDGEIAELCYISARGLSLEITGVVDGEKIENGFFGMHIYSVEDIKEINYDAILVSSMDTNIAEEIKKLGINHQKVYYL